MNFATLKGLTIPEGNVTKITDASGRVLWSAVEKATVTIKYEINSNSYNYNNMDATATIDGVVYNPVGMSYVGQDPDILEVNCGTEIVLHARNSVYLNGSSLGVTDYTYTVNGNVEIRLRVEYKQSGPSTYSRYGYVYITEQ